MKKDQSIQKILFVLVIVFAWGLSSAWAGGRDPYGQEDPNKKVLKQGLLGAATGAIAAGASGGKAGTGALIGAGTNVIGGALLDTLTAPSQPAYTQPYGGQPQQGYAQPQPGFGQQPVYYGDPPRQPVYAPPPPRRPDPTKNILRQGLLGAGTGAIAAGASGGKAGKGALIGAGTSILGGALLDSLMGPSQPAPQPAYYPPQQQPQPYYQNQPQQPKKRIIRKYDAEGNIISEEEIYE